MIPSTHWQRRCVSTFETQFERDNFWNKILLRKLDSELNFSTSHGSVIVKELLHSQMPNPLSISQLAVIQNPLPEPEYLAVFSFAHFDDCFCSASATFASPNNVPGAGRVKTGFLVQLLQFRSIHTCLLSSFFQLFLIKLHPFGLGERIHE